MVEVGSSIGIVIIAAGALLTTFNEGLSDLLGVSRVAFAMSRQSDLPRNFSKLGADQNPWRSVLLVGVVAIIVAAFAPFAGAMTDLQFWDTAVLHNCKHLRASIEKERGHFRVHYPLQD